MTPDKDFQQTCYRLAELRGQNEWFTDADRALTLRLAELIPASTTSPDRVVERGPRQIAVRTRKTEGSYRMRSGGYDKLAQRRPDLYRAVVTRKLGGEPRPTLMLSGQRWRLCSDEVRNSVAAPDVAAFRDPWTAAETLYEWRKAKRDNASEMEELRRETAAVTPLGMLWKGTGWAVKVYETGNAGTRSCNFEELRLLAPDVFAALVEEKPGAVTEWIDLRYLHREVGQVDLDIDGAPDSVCASSTGANPAVDETYFGQ